jgi:hypothetical protein
VGFVVNKVKVGQIFSKYFCFPCQTFYRTIIILGWYNKPIITSVTVDSVPLHPKKKKKRHENSLANIFSNEIYDFMHLQHHKET